MKISKEKLVLAYIQFFNKEAKVSSEREVRVELEGLPPQVKEESTLVKIYQGKLEELPDGYIRVRRETTDDGVNSYTFTRKTFSKNTEDTTEITENIFTRMMGTIAFDKQDKVRYKWNGWDIDVMDGGTKFVAEYELPDGVYSVDVPGILKIKKVLEPTISVPSNTEVP